MDAHGFVQDLALVLFVAAVTTVLFQRLRQPIVLGYLLAGAIVSPNTPIPLVANLETVHALAELGVILLMFSLGLEFSLRKLLRVGPRAAFVAVVQSSVMMWLGFAVGRAFDWTVLESLFIGAAIAISSTTIIIKAFQEQNVTGPLTSLVFAVLIVEDLIAILIIAILTPVASGSVVSSGALGATVLRLGLFLVGILGIGYLTIPRGVRFVLSLNRPETTLVASVGTCFAIAYLAQAAGYSVALGAFLAGSLVSESGENEQIERLVEPLRDAFAAVFFVSVGMLIDPALIAQHWPVVLVLTGVVVAGKLAAVSLGAFLGGYGVRTSIAAGLSLAQIGEFSFIIASVGLSLGAIGSFVYPVAVAVSAATTLLTPWLIRAAPRVASAIDRRMPHALQTFTALYASWIERLGSTPSHGQRSFGGEARRLAKLLLIDTSCVALITIGVSLGIDRGSGLLEETAGVGRPIGRLIVVAAGTAAAIPFALGILRCGRSLAVLVASHTFAEDAPRPPNAFARAPRNVLINTIHLAVLLLVGAPLVALTQPILPTFQGATVLVGALAIAGFLFWRSAKSLDAEVQAGAQTIIDALERALPRAGPEQPHVTAPVPGLAETRAFRIAEDCHAVGRTLQELDLRNLTGAIVLAIERDDQPAAVPSPADPLRPGDVLAIAGTRAAVEAGTRLLERGPG